MSSNKSFSTETSNRYAKALFELSNENRELETVEKNLKELLNIYNSNTELENFIKNPTHSFVAQLNVVDKLSTIMNFSKNLKNFLSILVKKRRIFFLKKIIISFLKLTSIKRGEIKAELTAAKELTEKEINSIKGELTKNFSSKIKLNYKYDPSLIGGLIVQVGSTMVDTSIKNKLQKITNKMIEA